MQELSGNENIVGLRVQGDDQDDESEPENTSRGNPVNGGEGDDSDATGGFTGTVRTATLTVLGVLTVSAVAALVGYKKFSKNRGRGLGSINDDDDLNSSCEESSIGDQTLQNSVLTADVACV